MNTRSRLESLAESIVNTLVGAVIAVASQYVIFPLVGIYNVSFGEHLTITAFFLTVSIVRQYIISRWFARGIYHTVKAKITGKKIYNF